MGLLDSVLAAMQGKTDASGAHPIMGALSGILARNGGLQGLAQKFGQSGQGKAFESWVGLSENQPVSSGEVQTALGQDQVNAIAAKLGIDPAQASHFLAEYLPKIIDKLTPRGQVDPNANHEPNLMALLPALMETLGGKPQKNE